jgi:ribose transport system substrate-binding protein
MDLDRSRRGVLRRVLVALALLTAAAVLVACGSDDEESGGAASSGGGSGAAGDCVAQVTDAVAEEKAPMQMVLPEEPFDMAQNKGKTIWYVSPSQATGYALALSKTVTAAAETAGMNVEIFDGKGRPDRFTEGLNTAVARGAAGVILYGIDPALVPEALKRAKAADVPVITMASGKPAPDDGTVVEALNHDLDAQGLAMANYGAMITECAVNGAVSFDKTYPALVVERDGIEKRLGEVCPDDCEVQDHEFQLAEMATALGPSTQTLIQRNPDLNVFFATFDQAATYQIPAIEQSGSDAKIVGTNGLEENLKAVKDGSPQVADVAYVPPEFFGWLGVDQLGRAIAGEKVGDANGDPFVMPVQTFDQENLPADVTDFDALFPELAGYEDAFREKWQM